MCEHVCTLCGQDFSHRIGAIGGDPPCPTVCRPCEAKTGAVGVFAPTDDKDKPIALSTTLHASERAALQRGGLDPDAYLALDFPINAMQPVAVNPKGSVFVAQFLVPPDTFEFLRLKKVIVGLDGKAPPPDIGSHLGLLPSLRLIIKQAALTDEAKVEMADSLQLQQTIGMLRPSPTSG